MAKLFLIIACVCYCTICMHQTVATAVKVGQEHVTVNKHHATVRQLDNEYDMLNVDTVKKSVKNKPFDEINAMKIQRGRRKQDDQQQQQQQYTNENSDLDLFDEFSIEYANKDSNYNNKDVDERKNLRNIIHSPRLRRHAGGEHGGAHIDLDSYIEINPNTQQFVRRLFKEFGDSEQETMNVIGFEKMLKRLGLYHLIEDLNQAESPSLPTGSNTSPTTKALNPQSNNETCMSSVSLISKISSNHDTTTIQQNYKKILDEVRGQPNTVNKQSNNLINNRTTIDSIKSIKENLNLTKNDLWSLCPILLYQLAAPTSLERSGCINSTLLLTDVHHHENAHDEYVETSRMLVWVYASLSIIIASLCGLLGVAVIPCMERRYYQYVLQFFVALAIGTLTGDALLHLMPHAMMTFSTLENGHNSMTWKGLVAALGIIFFFLTERILTMIAEWRKKIQKRDDPPARVRVMRDPDSVSLNQSLNGEKQCKHKYSSYPYCYDEIALETKDNHHHHHQHGTVLGHGKENGLKLAQPASPPKESLCAKSLNDRANDYSDTAQSLLTTRNHSNVGINDGYYRSGNGDKEDVQTPDNNTVKTNLEDGSLEACGCEHKKTIAPENYTIILREHESKHHGHSHTHGHVHSPPKTLSAVAWMVVMGDGLHNFTDGMAIGAAFSNNIAGGFSTAIAVFCHELPHELGDFAVLIKAGMSARKAVYYNVLSSVLSFFGMVLGIIVGDTPEASAWIFACAAGMFIYIALVDMMPELTTAHNDHCGFTQCFLQITGMILGVLIMLLIALFENDLKLIFASDSHDHHFYHHHH